MLILVIDDSRAIRAILRSMLQALKHTVIEAQDGAEGLSLLQHHPDVAVALVDWNMPVMNGLEFVQAVRAGSSRAFIRLIMVTTETEMVQVTRALQAGVDEYIMKPFTSEMIEEKLRLVGISATSR